MIFCKWIFLEQPRPQIPDLNYLTIAGLLQVTQYHKPATPLFHIRLNLITNEFFRCYLRSKQWEPILLTSKDISVSIRETEDLFLPTLCLQKRELIGSGKR